MTKFLSFKAVSLFAIVTFLLAPIPTQGAGGCSCKTDARFANLGTFRNFRDARNACRGQIRTRCLVDNCEPECPCSFACRSQSRIRASLQDGALVHTCFFRCTGGGGFCRASGMKDPHMHGFDGSRFNFHGEHGKNYVLFGRSHENIVARMRGVTRSDARIRHTYFDAFGLKTANGEQIKVSVVKGDAVSNSGWIPSVSIGGVALENDVETPVLKISMDKEQISIKTELAIYAIKAGSGKKDNTQHLDISIDLVGMPHQEGDYVGILGFTLNKALGHEVHEGLNVSDRTRYTLEKHMRKRFEVDSLFPSSFGDVDAMRGVARFISHGLFTSSPIVQTGGVSHPHFD